MPPPPILKISEVFASVQGEGLRQGQATIFVRLAGCNLRCSFCDTKGSWKDGRDLRPEQVLEIIQNIRLSFPAGWVCLTGGEPLLQNVEGLVRKLKNEGFMVQVETNGTRYRSMPVDWYTVSPKPRRYYCRSEYREKAKEVKVIVTRDLSLTRIRKLCQEFSPSTPLLLQPQSNRRWSIERSRRLLVRALRAGLDNVRLSCQLHKIFGLK